jgi:lipid A 4'-phosphatase
LVNGILKPLWGRARPYLVTQFGGEAQFTPAWVFSDQCRGDCSFVSGEMAGAVALAILLAMLARTYRGLWLLVGIVPAFTAWQRIAAGRHFLSDIVISALFVCLIALVLARQFAPARPPASVVDIQRSTP